ADVVVHVFEQKVHDVCKYLSGSWLFGTVTGLLYTIEFQKIGLPHCHTLLWVENKDKIQDAKDADRYILAELPDPKTDPKVLYTIEFQKIGLPHCHTLLWVENKDKIQDAKDADRYILAELPDPKTDPKGYRVVSEMMVHGLCGPVDPSASCMKENLYSKKFPKKFNNETYFDKNGYVYYRRRDTGVKVTKRGMDLDNSHVFHTIINFVLPFMHI
nr:DNA helicase [Tanacetum cinerariifolium]